MRSVLPKHPAMESLTLRILRLVSYVDDVTKKVEYAAAPNCTTYSCEIARAPQSAAYPPTSLAAALCKKAAASSA